MESALRKRLEGGSFGEVDPTQSRRMAAIRGKNTGPELTVRQIAHRLGYRFRLHRRDLPGCPDIVFPRLKKIIDVRGCFWHAHRCQRGTRRKVRRNYWEAKLARNAERDRRNLRQLRSLGWKVLVVWECEMADLHRLSARFVRFLGVASA
jgi:DNA mismatch endonuclease Vsr